MRTAYLDKLHELAGQDKNVFALISDNGAIVYDKFRKDFATQYINVGIAEASMIGMAAGMASRGKIPFAYTIGAFLAYRVFEFIRNDVALQKQNVKIVGTGAGMVYSALGPTHHTTEDLGVLRTIPNLTIFSPASPLDVKKVVQASYELVGPVYIRLGTNKEPEIYQEDYDFVVGRGAVLRTGNDLTFICTGSIINDVLAVADRLAEENIQARVINMHTIKPLDTEIIIKAARETKKIITVEEHNIIGGLGSAVAEVIAEASVNVQFERLGLRDKFAAGYGTHQDIKIANGLGQADIYAATKR